MQFTTPIVVSKSENAIDYNSKIVSMGSCFAENIGAKLAYYKFQNTVNPFGIIFNPTAIENLVYRAENEIEFTENDIFYHNERWQCYNVHSVVSNENKEIFLTTLNQILLNFKNEICSASHFIITYGTAWVYRLKVTNQVVANCHKVPQNQFEKVLLSVSEIEIAMKNTVNLILKINPKATFIFTVSPVRHSKDGFIENTLSKSHLIAAIHSSIFHYLCSNYFPSYEIMMDELRDYRFYSEDMLHPSQVAIDYIWEKFVLSQLSEVIYPIMKEVDGIQKALLHKPFSVNSASHTAFLKKLEVKIRAIKKTLPAATF